MNHFIIILKRELKLGFRNPWSYSFLTLFIVFMLSLLLINNQGYTSGYSGVTGLLMNLTLYLLPLITLMLGSFTLTGEKEDGSAALLYTYSLSVRSWIGGKYVGLLIVLSIIVTIGYGVTGIISSFTANGFSASTYSLLFLFSLLLIMTFLAIAMLIGSLAATRWQALTYVIGIWFFFIIGWSPTMIALLGQLPYLWIKPLLTVMTFFNPAEWIRIYIIATLGGGTIIGPEYYQWVDWINHSSGHIAFILLLAAYVLGLLALAGWIWKRGRQRD
jgi:Cu-processing system permease protein